MTKGIAHVSFSGGGIFLPARNPYDRQMLVDHVLSRVRIKGQVQVLIDDQRWMVHWQRGPRTASCAQCGYSVDSACYLAPSSGSPYCVHCAFGDIAASIQPPPVLERRAS